MLDCLRDIQRGFVVSQETVRLVLDFRSMSGEHSTYLLKNVNTNILIVFWLFSH